MKPGGSVHELIHLAGQAIQNLKNYLKTRKVGVVVVVFFVLGVVLVVLVVVVHSRRSSSSRRSSRSSRRSSSSSSRPLGRFPLNNLSGGQRGKVGRNERVLVLGFVVLSRKCIYHSSY